MEMKFATSLPWAGAVATRDNLVRFALAAEKAGFHRVIIGEHLLYPKVIVTPYPYTTSGSMPPSASPQRLEMFTTFAYLAGLTTRLRFQPGVAILPLRSPVAIAKATATLDYLSNGRFTLEVGVGWMREEFDALHVPFERRGQVLDEYIAVIRHLFAGGRAYEGEFISLPEVDFAPLPVQDPYPIHIGSGVGARALRRVAKVADGWSPIGVTLGELGEALTRLDTYLGEAGRSRTDLELSVQVGDGNAATMDREELLRQIEEATRLGATCLNVQFGQRSATDIGESIESMERFAAEVMSKPVVA
jgi:probable F420-dependent oxidoreductase